MGLGVLALLLASVGPGTGLLPTVPVSILLRTLMQGVSTVTWSTVFLAGSVLLGVVTPASVLAHSSGVEVDPVKTLKQE